MISINKQGNAIVIEFTDNDKYLFNGKIEVAPNELIVVVDQSDMVTFKRASNGDVLFSQLVDDIQIAGSPVTKDTVIDQFALIGFTSGGGGGEPGAVSSVNGQTGDVIITPASLNVYTRAEVDAAINAETTERQKQDSALGGMIAAETAAREQAVASKQDTLVSGRNIKTINGQSVLGEGNIAIQGGTSNWDDITGKPEFAEVATSGSYNDLSDKPEIPSDYIENITDSDTEFSIDTAFNYKSGKKYSLSFSKTGGFNVVIGGVGDTQRNINLSIDTDIIATKTELASKQDTLVSGTNIKTINGQTLLGEGNIDITGGGTITIDSELSTESENPVQNKVITTALNDKASKAELATKQDSINKYVSSITPSPQSTGFIFSTINVNAEGEPSIVDFQLNNTKDPDIEFEADRTNPAELKSYIKLSANVLKKSVADQTYATLEGLNTTQTELEQVMEKATANSADIQTLKTGKQDTLVSGTNIKTINGETILGAGDITIQAGGTVDTEMSDTSENAVQNKVIKKYIDDLVGNILTQLQEINGTN